MDWSLSLDAARERLKQAWDESTKAVEDKAAALTQLADNAAHAIGGAEARAIEAAGALADHLMQLPVGVPVGAAPEDAQNPVTPGKQQTVSRLEETVNRLTDTARVAVDVELRPLAAPLHEAGAAGRALLNGEFSAAVAHGSTLANLAGQVGIPVEKTATDAYLEARGAGQKDPATAAVRAAWTEMKSQANGLNPLYNLGVAGVEYSEAGRELSGSRHARAVFEHLQRGETFLTSAVAVVAGAAEASGSTEALGTAARDTLPEVEAALPSAAETLVATEPKPVGTRMALEEIELRRAVQEVKAVNPGFDELDSAPGRSENCLNAAAITDAVMDERPASALPSIGPMSVDELEADFGATFFRTTEDGIRSELTQAGPGSRAIIFVKYDGPQGMKPGHAFNAVNRNGFVLFVDGHRGREGSFAGVNYIEMMWTKRGSQ